MLRRIISIKNVGRFRNSAATPNPALAKHTLVFGANAYGKTTFCTIMRSLQSGDGAIILGRKTLGTADAPTVDLLFSAGNRRFQNGNWSAIEPQISIFDGAFVAANVHSGDVVDVTHRRNLYRVIVGHDGVELAEEEQSLAEQARAKQGELTGAERAVQALLPRGIVLRDYLSIPADPAIDAKIEAQRQIVSAVGHAEAIRTRAALVPMAVPTLPAGTATTLAKSIAGVAEDAEARLAAHVLRHRMQESGERWISEGLAYVVEDHCPFCGRDGLQELDLVKSYQAHFSEAYDELHNEVSTLQDEVDGSFGDAAEGRLRAQIERNLAALEFWRHHCAMGPDALADQKQALARMQEIRTELHDLLGRKASALLQPIFDPLELETATRNQAEIAAFFEAYNFACAAANGLIQAVKDAAGSGDLASVESELVRLEMVKRRHDPATVTACDLYSQFDAEKRELERRKEEVRDHLEAHTARVIEPYENRINHFLDLFNAGFQIVRTSHGYPGGIATSTYQLLIANNAVDLRDSRTPNDRPSFKNTLSAGDRATLALAFFLAQLEREPDIAERLVVLDDPFNSQDAFRRHQTIHEIIAAANASLQIIVLSHDANFLQQVWNKLPTNERVALQIIFHQATGSKILEFDLEDACRGRARAELDDLLAFRATGAGNLREIIKKLRVVLETFLRSSFPGFFAPEDNLGTILQKIRVGANQHPAHGYYETLDRINDYTANYHHGEGPRGAAEPPLDQAELMGFVNTTLKTVNALPA